jgi:hypothetical protein
MSHRWFVLSATRGLDERQQPTTDGAQGLALEAENLGFGQAGALVMRLGLADQDLTGSGITGTVEWIGKHVTNAGVEEFWAAGNNSGTAVLARRVSGTWSSVSFSDTVTVANLRYMQGATLNGFFALMYDSDVNRAHVWDGTALRRMGLDVSGVGSVANTGAGAYAATARRYRYAQRIKSGTTILAQSELSAAVSFTPSGGGTAARHTKPTTVDSATHWVIYGLISTSGDTYDLYEEIAEVAIGTTTYDDSVDPVNYSGEFPPPLGSNVPPPSAKYVTEDGERFFFAGAWESSGTASQTQPATNVVWFTPPLGASTYGDSERIPDTDDTFNGKRIGNGGPLTAVAGPVDGLLYALKADSVHKLAPTGDETNPYRARRMTDACGAIDQRTVLVAENGEGVPCIYFASRTAVYQIVGGQIRELSEPIRRDLRLANFSAALSLLGWDPLEKTLLAQTRATGTAEVGQYHQFLYDVASDRWTGASFGTFQAGWVLGRSILGVNTKLTVQSFIRTAVTALDEDGIPRLMLGGQDPDAAGTITAFGAQGGADVSTPYTARLRLRLPLGSTTGQCFDVGAPTVVYRNPIGTDVVTTTLTVTYVRDDGEMVSASTTLVATGTDDPLGNLRVTLEGLAMGDLFVLDLRLQVSCSASFGAATVPVAIDSIWVPVTLRQELAA